jgi:MFS family permease
LLKHFGGPPFKDGFYGEVEMRDQLTWLQRLELMTLLFVHGMALASWFVPMGAVLKSAELGSITPFAFAASAIAALMSPLFFGAMADRAVPPIRILRWVSLGTAILVAGTAKAIEDRWNGWSVLLLIQLQSLLSMPTTSLTGSIVFARLANSQRQFGAIRALGTAGWMVGCWLVSLFLYDTSPHAFYMSSLLWLGLSAYTLLLPNGQLSIAATGHMSLRERFGLDALALLKIRDHRVIFATVTLVAIPFAAFYPYTPAHMSDLGLLRTSAWMSLGQVIEVAVMVFIGGILARWSLKWVIVTGLACGILRYVLYAQDAPVLLVIGVCLHGLAYTFTYISAQIYLAEKIEAAWRTRAQALLSMMTGGIGNLVGYLLTGSWFSFCQDGELTDWPMFWGGLCGLVLLVTLYFLRSFRG